eukprot:m.266152 g.266152  ORF g.266152 m.266152 type:complete len:274 (-) comp30899_c0_seq1:22-843(-)
MGGISIRLHPTGGDTTSHVVVYTAGDAAISATPVSTSSLTAPTTKATHEEMLTGIGKCTDAAKTPFSNSNSKDAFVEGRTKLLPFLTSVTESNPDIFWTVPYQFLWADLKNLRVCHRPKPTFQVFLSFRKSEAQAEADLIYKALTKHLGVRTFHCEKSLHKGQQIATIMEHARTCALAVVFATHTYGLDNGPSSTAAEFALFRSAKNPKPIIYIKLATDFSEASIQPSMDLAIYHDVTGGFTPALLRQALTSINTALLAAERGEPFNQASVWH